MMRRPPASRLVVLVLVLGTAGCATRSYYFGNRINDLADVVQVELTFGLGVEAHLKLTDLFNLGWGFSKSRGFVMDGRRVGVGERSTGAIIPFPGTSDVVLTDASWMWEPPPVTDASSSESTGRKWADRPRSSWASALDLEAGLTVLAGAHLGVSPLEAVDFIFGILGLDLAGDDVERPPPPAATPADKQVKD